MDTFKYKAKNVVTQRKVKGEMEGKSAEHVYKTLVSKNLKPISVKKKQYLQSESKFFSQSIKLKDLTLFCKQFGAMLQAGVPVNKSLMICGENCRNEVLKNSLNNIHSEINQGKSLSEAFKRQKRFPYFLVRLIEIGEVSGDLGRAIKESTKYFDRQLVVRGKVRKALAYPLVVVSVMLVVMMVLMISVMPNYVALLEESGADMPFMTQLVISGSQFIVNEWPILIVVCVLTMILLMIIGNISAIKKKVQRLCLRLPLIGNLNKKVLSATFASTVSILLISGVSILEALEVCKKMMRNTVAKEEMTFAIAALREGNSLLGSIKDNMIFSPVLLSMISIGEESGALDEMLIKSSEFFQEEVERTIDYLITLIEPMLMILIAIIIGGMMAAILLPTFSAANAVMSW